MLVKLFPTNDRRILDGNRAMLNATDATRLGVASAAAGLGFEASPRANGFHQVHREGNRHLEMRRSGPARMTVLNKPDNAFPQIKRIGL
jgi:hypothetical protein